MAFVPVNAGELDPCIRQGQGFLYYLCLVFLVFSLCCYISKKTSRQCRVSESFPNLTLPLIALISPYRVRTVYQWKLMSVVCFLSMPFHKRWHPLPAPSRVYCFRSRARLLTVTGHKGACMVSRGISPFLFSQNQTDDYAAPTSSERFT